MTTTRRSRNILLLLLALFLAALMAVGCRRDDAVIDLEARDSASGTAAGDSAAITTTHRDDSGVAAAVAPSGFDACNIQKHVTAALDSIMRWPRQTLAGNDTCVLNVLDSLAESFAASGGMRYLAALDTCGNYSDGYIGEFYSDVAGRLWSARPAELVRYLHAGGRPESQLRTSLVEQWRRDVEESPDSASVKQRTLSGVRSMLPSGSLTPAEHAYLDGILRDARLIP
jgi:hypothetical protein